MPKPLPPQILNPNQRRSLSHLSGNKTGIVLGDNILWNPTELPNGHVVLIGASGSGKTQTLKALAYELPKLFPEVKIVIIDFHNDQQLPCEVCYPLNMESPYGVNPLTIDLDTKGGGPALQALAVAQTLKRALAMGPNQEGLLISILNTCYSKRGISQDCPVTWGRTPPTFADAQAEIHNRIESGDKEAQKLALKLATTFQYGIFAKEQPSLTDHPLIRFDLSALGKVPGLSAIAAEMIAKQLMDSHRIKGETPDKLPKSFLFIDESKEIKGSRSIKTLLCDGRKFGLNAVLASQRDCHLDDDVIANSATKIVLSVDQTEVAKVSKRFRFAPDLVAALEPLEALVRMGTAGHRCHIKPYYERLE